jgi:hypothetical protein
VPAPLAASPGASRCCAKERVGHLAAPRGARRQPPRLQTSSSHRCVPARKKYKKKKCARLSQRWAPLAPPACSCRHMPASLPRGAGVWAGCAVSSCRTGLIERCPHVTGALNLRASPPASSPCLNAVSREGIASARRTSALLRIGARAPPYSPLCSVRLLLMGRAISCAR